MTNSNLKFGFGFSAVNDSVKASAVEVKPQMIVRSTDGAFTLTAPAAKALGIAPGDYVMFMNNIDQIEAAIAAKNPDIVKFAEDNGLSLDTKADVDSIVSSLTQWVIAKGIAKKKANGTPMMCSVRMTKADKAAWLKENMAAFVADNRDELITKYELSAEATDEEIASNVSVDDVASPLVEDFKGCKVATTSSATGVGVQVNFTYAALWNQLKADLEDKKSKNRIFDVDLDTTINTVVNNGFEDVDVVAYPINFAEDVDPMRRGENKD